MIMITTNLTNNDITANEYYYYTTNTTTTTGVWTTTIPSYQPYQSNIQYVYDTDFSWRYSSNDYGVREYMFANNLYVEISDILLSYYKDAEDDQEFEDNLYRLTLDLLYEYIHEERAFEDFFNENLFKYGEINKIIQEIIDRYHTIIMEEC